VIGFKRDGRLFRNQDCLFILDFPAPPVGIGKECPIKKFKNIKTGKGVIKMLSPTDSVKDRLAAYFYWNDPQSLEQAIMIAAIRKIDVKDIEKWVRNEGKSGEYGKIKKYLSGKK